MSEFEKTCTYCNNKIKLSDSTGKWLPYNLDNSPHDCRPKPKPMVNPSVVDSLVEIHKRDGMTETKTEFTQNDINILEQLLAKMKATVTKK